MCAATLGVRLRKCACFGENEEHQQSVRRPRASPRVDIIFRFSLSQICAIVHFLQHLLMHHVWSQSAVLSAAVQAWVLMPCVFVRVRDRVLFAILSLH